MRERFHWAARLAWASVTLAAGLVIAACLALLGFFAFFATEAERYTSGLTPRQFERELDAELLDDYGGVFGVAHNSGDSVAATRQALANGADVIEIDVVSFGGRLYAGHDTPLPFIGDRFFRGPELGEAWEAAHAADAVKLDLKERSPGYLAQVIEFLRARNEVPVIVATRDRASLDLFAASYPAAIRLLSIGDRHALGRFMADPAEQELIDGITIRHTLLDETSAAWLQAESFLVLAWTVNDVGRMNELVRVGVDAITTDNLAIMRLLGDQERGEALLEHRSVP